VLLTQMERAEDVEDLGGLAGAPPKSAEVNPVLPLDASEGPSAVPMLIVASEDPVSASAPTEGEDTLKLVAEPAVEDPMPAVGPSQVAK
jgi:hypothetical protein